MQVTYVVMDKQQVDAYKEAIEEYRAASNARMPKSAASKSNYVALPKRQINNYFVQFRKVLYFLVMDITWTFNLITWFLMMLTYDIQYRLLIILY